MSFPRVRIGSVFDIRNGGTPSSTEPSYWDGQVPWVTPADLGRLTTKRVSQGERNISEEGLANSNAQLVPAQTIILSIRAPIGHVALASEPMAFNQGCRGLIPSKAVNPTFAYYALLAHRERLQAAGQGTTFLELSRARLVTERIPLPDFETQQRIADFLDRETARIDELIEKRLAFIELVDEKKKAIASQLLNGELLKQSKSGAHGWFGTLPDDWSVRRMKFLFRERQDRSIDGAEELLTVSHLTGVSRRADRDVNMFLAETTEGYKLVSPGDVVINTMWAWMGAMGVSPYEGLISPSYGVYAPITDSLDPIYTDIVLRSERFVAEVNRRSKGVWSSRLRLYPDAFLDIPLPVPPLRTQSGLVRAYTQAIAREEQLARLNQRSINKLRELRSALITASVTGNIDVRTGGGSDTLRFWVAK